MKYINIKFLLIAVLALQFVSCEKEHEDIGAVVENVPEIHQYGDNPIFHLKGLEFVDPGIYADLYVGNDTIEDLPFKVSGSVNDEIEGSYTLTYEVLNENNISFYSHRLVNVVDFTGYDVVEIPEGTWDGLRVNRDDGGPVQITKIREGIYSISDLLAGYYYKLYGDPYTAPALLIVDDKGGIRSELGSGPWGGVTAVGINFDETANTMTYVMTMDDGFSFDVLLTFNN